MIIIVMTGVFGLVALAVARRTKEIGIRTLWFPDMIKAGLRHFAWVFSRDIFAELSAKKVMPANDIVKSFSDLEDAKKWLISA